MADPLDNFVTLSQATKGQELFDRLKQELPPR